MLKFYPLSVGVSLEQVSTSTESSQQSFPWSKTFRKFQTEMLVNGLAPRKYSMACERFAISIKCVNNTSFWDIVLVSS